ncbi:hypothetical protein JXA02_05690 [candidate division KSB1 bacterium]|nr:hypothetical protein [candidate division KSB1 bacterium]RQW07814.1 MAG: hypothetical protein EH222_06505 [candidate division KSB1 bacterium]
MWNKILTTYNKFFAAWVILGGLAGYFWPHLLLPLKKHLDLFVAAISLNILGLILGYVVGHLCRFNMLRKRALSIEIGMQNAGLGSVLALKHFNERAALPAVIFVFTCIFTASLLASLWSQKIRS